MMISIDSKTGDLKGVFEVRRGEEWSKTGEGMRSVDIIKTFDAEGGDVRSFTSRIVSTRDFYEKRAGCMFSSSY